MKINILIRTHNRPRQFRRCIESVCAQTYKNTHIIIHTDNDHSRGYVSAIMTEKKLFYSHTETDAEKNFYRGEFFYNLYCNKLLQMVETGWLMFLDDDDVLADQDALTQISKYFDKSSPIICQMLRRGMPKPTNRQIRDRDVRSGHIGMPCIFIHSSEKIMNFTDVENADFLWLQQYVRPDTRFVAIPVVSSAKRNYGRPE